MAQILHCDCCKASDGSINGNYKPPGGIGPIADQYAVPEHIKVWHAVTFHGHTFDICNICLAKVEAVVGFKFNFDVLKEKEKAEANARKQGAKSKPNNIECGKCHHAPHEVNKCMERICDAAGDMDYCPC